MFNVHFLGACSITVFGEKIQHVIAQPSRHFVGVGSLSLWRDANCDIGRTTLLGTLCLSDRSRCGAVRNLISLAQPSRHFVRVGSLSLWRGTDSS